MDHPQALVTGGMHTIDNAVLGCKKGLQVLVNGRMDNSRHAVVRLG